MRFIVPAEPCLPILGSSEGMIGKRAQQVQITQDKIMASAVIGEISSHILGAVLIKCRTMRVSRYQ